MYGVINKNQGNILSRLLIRFVHSQAICIYKGPSLKFHWTFRRHRCQSTAMLSIWLLLIFFQKQRSSGTKMQSSGVFLPYPHRWFPHWQWFSLLLSAQKSFPAYSEWGFTHLSNHLKTLYPSYRLDLILYSSALTLSILLPVLSHYVFMLVQSILKQQSSFKKNPTSK